MSSAQEQADYLSGIDAASPARDWAVFEANVAQVLDGVHDAVLAVDRDWRITYLNAPAGRWLRREAAELLGHSLWEAAPDLAASPLAAVFRDAITHCRSVASEGYLPSLDSWAKVRAAPSANGLLIFASDITEQKRVEEALRESESRFRATFIQAAVGMALVGLDGRWLRVNERLCAITGFSQVELLARTFQEITHPDDLADDLAQVARLLTGEIDTYTLEKRYIRKDGSPVWINLTVTLARRDDGSPDYFIAVIEDITARHRVEDALRLQAGLLDQAYNANYAWEWDGGIILWNRGAERLYGYARNEAIGRVSHELLQTRFPAGLDAVLTELEGAGQWEGEVEQTRRDGSRIFVESRLQLHVIGERRIVLEANRDITEQRRIEQERERLREQEQATLALLDTLLNASPNGFAFFDTELRFRRVNQALAAFHGVPAEAHIGRTIAEVLPATADAAQTRLRSVLETGTPLKDVEVSGETPASPGEVRHWLISYYPVPGPDRHLLGVGATVVDITDRKRFEERLRQSEERLRIALGGSPIVVYQQDRDLRYTWIYNYARAPSNAVLGKTDAQLLPPDEAAALIALKRRVLETGTVERAVIRATTNQWTAHYDLTVEPVRDETGAIVGVTGSAVDITSQKEREERIARLQDLTVALAGAVDATAVARAIVEHGVAAVGANFGVVSVLSADGKTLVARASVGVDPAAVEQQRRVPIDDQSAIAEAGRRREPIFLETGQERIERYPDVARYHRAGSAGAAVALPLSVEDRLIGVLGFGFLDDRPFDDEARDYLRALADLCAQALERARLYDVERQTRDAAQKVERRLALLLDVTAALSEALTVEEIVDVVLKRAVPAVNAQGGTVTLLSPDGQEFEIAGSVGMPHRLVEGWRRYPLVGPYPLSDAARTARPVWIERPADWAERYPESYAAFLASGFQSLASIPLIIEGRLLGGIGYDFTLPRTFGNEDRAFMVAMSQQVAQALDRARLYEAERAARAGAQAAELRYRSLFERSADAVMVVDRSGAFLDANPAALALLGYDRDELATLRLPDLAGASWTDDASSALVAASSWQSEFEIRRKDGISVPVEARAAAIQTPTGQATMIAARDISERRGLELMQQDFFASISHDLKNPLAALKGQVQLLQRRALRKGSLEIADLESGLQTIQSVGDRMSGMIEELVDVAQLRGGSALRLKRQATNLVAIAERRVREHQQATTRHGIHLDTTEPSLIGWWDEARLGRVIDNLLTNAVKYSLGGDIHVRLGREARGEDDWAVLRIEDNGVGIPSADLPHIFERFRRGSNVRDRFAGTGLGLSGVRQIIVQHGGDVTIASAEGVGTTVTVALPLREPPPNEREIDD